MDEKTPDKNKVLHFPHGKNMPLTPVEMLKNALEEATEYPSKVKHAFVILMDENDEPSFWGTFMSKAQYSKCCIDFTLHTHEVLRDNVILEDHFEDA